MAIKIDVKDGWKAVFLRCKANCGAQTVQYRNAAESDADAVDNACTGSMFHRLGDDVSCSAQCDKFLADTAHKVGFEVSGEEAGRRHAERGARTVAEAREAENDKRFPRVKQACVRCGKTITIQRLNRAAELAANGYLETRHGVTCGTTCLAWLDAKEVSEPPVVPVLTLNDASYQRGRANKLNAPVLQPGEAMPTPPARGGRKP